MGPLSHLGWLSLLCVSICVCVPASAWEFLHCCLASSELPPAHSCARGFWGVTPLWERCHFQGVNPTEGWSRARISKLWLVEYSDPVQLLDGSTFFFLLINLYYHLIVDFHPLIRHSTEIPVYLLYPMDNNISENYNTVPQPGCEPRYIQYTCLSSLAGISPIALSSGQHLPPAPFPQCLATAKLFPVFRVLPFWEFCINGNCTVYNLGGIEFSPSTSFSKDLHRFCGDLPNMSTS